MMMMMMIIMSKGLLISKPQKINDTQQNNNVRLCGESDELVNHIKNDCKTIVT